MIDYVAQLNNVNKAIAAIEGGAQEYRLGARSLRRGDLATLYAERRRLEGIIESGQCGTTLARIARKG